MVKTETLPVASKGRIDVVNLEGELQRRLDGSGLQDGILTLFVPGSTAALTTIEFEPGLVADIKESFSRLFPYGAHYAHHDTWHDDNGSSHLQAALLGPSLTIPVVDGRMTLGTWQQPVLIDFDTRPRNRRLVIQFLGEFSALP